MTKTTNCSLCTTPTTLFWNDGHQTFLRCSTCQAIQRHPHNHLSPEQEKKRYETHNNDVNDPGYQEFVRPMVESILRNHISTHQGLDFGCGPGPVITKLLRDHRYTIRTYDPFFDNDQTVFDQKYNYIACCEVIEHFRHPAREFRLLRSLLKPGAKLYCKTDIYTDDIDFPSWYYKNDPTHVFFYHPDTLEWIATQLGFRSVQRWYRYSIFQA